MLSDVICALSKRLCMAYYLLNVLDRGIRESEKIVRYGKIYYCVYVKSTRKHKVRANNG